jgi:hypothetical protein
VIGPNVWASIARGRDDLAGDYPDQEGFPSRSGLRPLSQSGGNCILCISEPRCEGLFFSKAISYGNAGDFMNATS